VTAPKEAIRMRVWSSYLIRYYPERPYDQFLSVYRCPPLHPLFADFIFERVEF